MDRDRFERFWDPEEQWSDRFVTPRKDLSNGRSVADNRDFFCTDYEERSVLAERVKATKIDITTIHDIESRRFENKLVEDRDIVSCALGDTDKTRDSTTQVHKGMQFDRSFAFAKVGPGKKGEAKIDRG